MPLADTSATPVKYKVPPKTVAETVPENARYKNANKNIFFIKKLKNKKRFVIAFYFNMNFS
jgi:hypothetical protein